jgi:hypothetical protein
MKSLLLLAAAATLSTWAFAAETPGFKVIYHFDNPDDPSYPNGLVEANGVLYGTSVGGGVFGYGAVFALQRSPAPDGGWTFTVLHSFNPSTGDASEPYSTPAVGPEGVLYGTTLHGGNVPLCQGMTPPGCGTVYTLQPPAAPGGEWTETTLYTFPGGSNFSTSSPVLCKNPSVCTPGSLYVTGGGILELQPPSAPGGDWTPTVLRSGVPGGPEGLTMNDQGVLCGVTQYGGGATLVNGTVFTLAPPDKPGKPWRKTTLYRFRGRHEGSDLEQPPSIAEDGTIYGTTAGFGCDGEDPCQVAGSVFALTPPSTPGGAWAYTLPHSAGKQWVTSQAARRGDTIYATTGRRLLKIQRDPATGTWATTTLHTFASDTISGGPLVVDKNGTIFGTAGIYNSSRYLAYSFKP